MATQRAASDGATTSTVEPTPSTPAFDLAIVGGGIAGVLLAIAATHHAPQIKLTLYESASKFGEIGAGVAFSPNAGRAMAAISPEVKAGFERIRTSNKDPEKRNVYFEFRAGMDGLAGNEGIKEDGLIAMREYDNILGVTGGGGMVHRANFLDQMVSLLPEGIAQFRKRLVDVDDEGARGVTLRFADGTSATHAGLVACDGIKSRARQIVLGNAHPAAQPVFTGKYCYRGLIPMEEAVQALGEDRAANSQMYWGYHGHVLTFPVRHGEIMNVVAFTSKDTWDSEEWVVSAEREDMYHDFDGWGKSVQSILRMMQKPDIWALFNHSDAPTYCKGRICLAGDAAHASTPHQGAGAGMAVEDAYVMSQILKQVKTANELDVAFEAFDHVRRPRTQKLVRTSKEAGQLYDFELTGVEDDPQKLKQNIMTRMEWIWNKNIEDDIAEARDIMKERIRY